MQHVEFFDKEHFEQKYHRVKPPKALNHFIDFFWQTKFEDMWEEHPAGFSDALFPNIGYTYLVNLGTPFIMQVGDDRYTINKDSFLPRHTSIECHHQPGNVIFGIKFKISPVIFEKKVNFSEYKRSMAPLSYLIDKKIIDELKQDITFEQRVAVLNHYFTAIVKKFEGSLKPISIVSEILDSCYTNNDFSVSISQLAAEHDISTRTLQRYFENATSLSSKQTLQILRVRKAVAHLSCGGNFDHKLYGYYDYSHFYKHLRQFLHKPLLENLHGKLVRLNRVERV